MKETKDKICHLFQNLRGLILRSLETFHESWEPLRLLQYYAQMTPQATPSCDVWLQCQAHISKRLHLTISLLNSTVY